MGPPLVKKKVDSRIRTLIENGVKSNHRSFFVVVGDRGRDQVMFLHYMLSKARVAAKPSVLWCYKKELGFTTHRKKRMKQIQKQIKNGLREADEQDPFELFIAGTDIRYCYYKESEKILGNTYGMCVLQDFEALTPNLLARAVETVEGGGICVLLLRTMKSLKQLYSMTMDVHSRYRTESHHDVVGRFNERFILSLGACEHCLIVDDELNILPISAGRKVTALPTLSSDIEDPQKVDLNQYQQEYKDLQPAGTLVKMARTVDQAKAVKQFIDAISEKTLRNTVSLTAARGRGKSAALGIAMASAVAYGYSNIFVTSPSPENLKTLFEIMFKAFEALGYQQHIDYDIHQSTNPDFNKAVVRVNIFRDHRQTIQYIRPQDAHVLGQAELVVIDEAAAIPLPVVKKLLGPYLVFMASTINGYEGTGRSLSLKLLQQLRDQASGKSSIEGSSSSSVDVSKSFVTGRALREVKLETPIRYGADDPTEKWLNNLLCLDVNSAVRSHSGCPHPAECDLYYVNRDTLFSYHPVSEAFLQRMMNLYVASHYKNTPNDLQLMSDAPAHQLFVLLPPIKDESVLPEPLAVIQTCMEGEISRQSLMQSLSRGKKADGDLIPWAISQQFQDEDFATLSGARVVRIAVHPDYNRMGYGSRALELLLDYYNGNIQSTDEMNNEDLQAASEDLDGPQLQKVDDSELSKSTLHSEQLTIRDASQMPPLLLTLSEKKPPLLHWIGVSYGLTPELNKFWKRANFTPVYLRQTANELTGEYTCIMLRTLERSQSSYDPQWLNQFTLDFKKRFLSLCGFGFRQFSINSALHVLDSVDTYNRQLQMSSDADNQMPLDQSPITSEQINQSFTAYDIKRLESYAKSMLDYHVILDLVPTIAQHFFNHQLKTVKASSLVPLTREEADDDDNDRIVNGEDMNLSAIQRNILFGIGCQLKSVDDVASELKVPVGQLLALFVRIIRKCVAFYKHVLSVEIAKEIKPQIQTTEDASDNKKNVMDKEEWEDKLEEDMDAELESAGRKEISELKQRQREMIDSLNLSAYAIGGKDEDWNAVSGKQLTKKGSGVVSVKSGSSKTHKRPITTVDEVAKEGKQMLEKMRNQKSHKKSKKHRN
ncbi:hypothetical protein MIR68_000227 [Amoeboaphelidium protococcarum]|nr:hypothetical protein MIR68_000227 [Amoeboaphelidium protococcarum]